MKLPRAIAIFALSVGMTIPTRALDGLHYSAEGQVSFSSGEHTPFWLVSNRNGLSSIEKNNGYFRAGLFRDMDTVPHFSWGFGADLAVAYNFSSSFIVQQLYGEIRYRKATLSLGSKIEAPELLDQRLSSGDLLFSGNARPIPQLKLSLPDYIDIPGLNNWLGVKGYFSFGMFTDDKWQRDFAGSKKHTEHVLFHSKGGFIRIGNTSKFPLTFEGGLEMAAQFGGRRIIGDQILEMPHGLKDFIKVIFPSGGGEDTPVGEQTNVYGNHVGEWKARLTWHAANDWKFSAYYEHFFEDHSMMFFDYTWKDCLAGIQIDFPKNPVISSFVYEFLNTKDQSGPVYWDHTTEIPEQVSGRDNYYNHSIYTGWQHWGMGIGNPLVISPIYNSDGTITFKDNRLKGHHIGFEGSPTNSLSYRVLLSYTRNWGSYSVPFHEVKNNYNGLLEITYKPEKLSGWSVSLSGAMDAGGLLGRSAGAMLTIKKSGIL